MCETEGIGEVILALAIILVDAIKSSLANVLRVSPCVVEVNIGALPTQM